MKPLAEQAAQRAREEAKDFQAKRELGQAYADLGRAAFDLVERGELSHTDLEAPAGRVRAARAKLQGEETAEHVEPPPSDAPPAMPT